MSAVRFKIRLYDLAKDLGVDTKRLIHEIRSLGVDVSVPSNSISKTLANQIRDKYSPKKDDQNKRASKFLRTNRFSGPLPALTKKDPAVKENSLGDKSGRTLVQHTTTPLDDKTLTELRVNVLHTLDRAPDAKQVKQVLESYGVNISLFEVPDDSLSSRHRGTIYYFLPGNDARNAAKRLSKIVRAIEVVVPQFHDLHGTLELTHSMWLVRRTPSLAPKTYESDGTPKTSTSCHLCGYVCHPKKLNDHLLNNHPEEAFAEVSRKLGLQKTNRATFFELHRKSFGELRWFIDACLRGWQDILIEKDQKLVTTDKETLFEYARILESKISGGSIRKRQDVLARLLRDIESYKARIPAKKLKWKLLPPGEAPFPKIIEHFRHFSRERTRAVYDLAGC